MGLWANRQLTGMDWVDSGRVSTARRKVFLKIETHRTLMGFETVRDGVDSEAIKMMKQRLSGIETEEMRRKGLALVTQPSDIFVVTTVRLRHHFTMGAQLKLDTRALAVGLALYPAAQSRTRCI